MINSSNEQEAKKNATSLFFIIPIDKSYRAIWNTIHHHAQWVHHVMLSEVKDGKLDERKFGTSNYSRNQRSAVQTSWTVRLTIFHTVYPVWINDLWMFITQLSWVYPRKYNGASKYFQPSG
jgi:hypothetical protein